MEGGRKAGEGGRQIGREADREEGGSERGKEGERQAGKEREKTFQSVNLLITCLLCLSSAQHQ